MQTIGRHFHGDSGESIALCDYCGVLWYRSQLTRNADGRLHCQFCMQGRCLADIAADEIDEAAAMSPQRKVREEP